MAMVMSLKAMAGPPSLRPWGSQKSLHHRSTLSTTPKLLEHQLCELTHLQLQTCMGFISVARPLTFECVHLYCVCRCNTEQYSPYASPSPQGSYQPSPSPQSYHQLVPSPVTRTRTLLPATIQLPWPIGYVSVMSLKRIFDPFISI